MPQPLRDRPDLPEEWKSHYLAFRSLSKSRLRTDVGPQAITVTEILAYCKMAAFDSPDDRSQLLYMVQELDDEYLTYAAEKQRKAMPPKK